MPVVLSVAANANTLSRDGGKHVRPQFVNAFSMVFHLPFNVFLLDGAWKSSTNSSKATSRARGLESSTKRPRSRCRREGASHLSPGRPPQLDEEELGPELVETLGSKALVHPNSSGVSNFLAFLGSILACV